jgi:hypothetical protein
MRERAIVLLAAVSSFVFLAARAAHAQLPLDQRSENVQQNEPGTGHGLYGSIVSPRMITWSICSSPSSGSALSVYSSGEKPARYFRDSATPEDVYSEGCNDQEEENWDESLLPALDSLTGNSRNRVRTPM